MQIVTTESGEEMGKGLTGAQRVVGALELLAWCKILAFGGDAFEVIRVILVACVDELKAQSNAPIKALPYQCLVWLV